MPPLFLNWGVPTMTKEQALALLIDAASVWVANETEGLSEHIMLDTTDEDCERIADASDAEAEDVVKLRNVLRAVEILDNKDIFNA